MPLIAGALATMGVTLPSLTDTQISGYVYAVMYFGAIGLYAWSAIWSWRQKTAARAKEIAAAVASAEHGVPVVVTVTPPGEPNIATRVSATEAAAAPSVPIDQKPLPAPLPA